MDFRPWASPWGERDARSMMQFRHIHTLPGCLVVAIALTACSSGSTAAKPTSTTRSPRTTSTTTTTPRPEGWATVPNAPSQLGKYAVWTGTEYIGGPAGCCDGLGGTEVVAYTPSSNTWRSLPAFPLSSRSSEVTAWTGHEMVVVGGRQAASAADTTQSSSVPSASGAALDPATNTWRTIASMPAPMASPIAAVWTGREVVVFDDTHTYRYRPATDQWRIGAAPPFARNGVVVVSTGHQILVWGGSDPQPPEAVSPPLVVHADGASYDPATDVWRKIPSAPVPARADSKGVWTGQRMIVWGGVASSGTTNGRFEAGLVGKGASYDPVTRTWQALPASPLKARSGHQMVWTGHEVVVWGGSNPSSSLDPLAGYPRDGAAYDPATNQWRRLPAAPASPPALLTADSAVWTGDLALFLGGDTVNAQGVGPLGLSYAPGR